MFLAFNKFSPCAVFVNLNIQIKPFSSAVRWQFDLISILKQVFAFSSVNKLMLFKFKLSLITFNSKFKQLLMAILEHEKLIKIKKHKNS